MTPTSEGRVSAQQPYGVTARLCRRARASWALPSLRVATNCGVLARAALGHRIFRAVRRQSVAGLVLIASGTGRLLGQGRMTDVLPAVQVAHGIYVLRGSTGNLVVGTGPSDAVVVGAQAPSLTGAVQATVRRLTRAPIRFVVLMPSDSAWSALDAGWERLGATVVMHEAFGMHLERPDSGVSTPAGGRGHGPWLALPTVGFSQVVQLRIGGDEVHVVHQPAAYSDADAIAHFEHAGVLYLGNAYTADGYPAIDVSRGGSLVGTAELANKFIRLPADTRVVPGRGAVSTIRDLAEYHAMLVAILDRVRGMIAAGKSRDQVLAARPSADFDARWGHGPVTADSFVDMAYRSLSRGQERRR